MNRSLPKTELFQLSAVPKQEDFKVEYLKNSYTKNTDTP